jgi:biopolymer transport protein TolR
VAFSDPNGMNTDTELTEINVVPLVDVLLVLLIIFMVTAPLSIGGIKVNLPNSKAGALKNIDEDRIVLTIDKSGAYFLDKMHIPAASLQTKLKAIYEFRQKKNLYIRADRNVAHGRVIDAMSAGKIAGVKKIAMLTKQPAKAK